MCVPVLKQCCNSYHYVQLWCVFVRVCVRTCCASAPAVTGWQEHKDVCGATASRVTVVETQNLSTDFLNSLLELRTERGQDHPPSRVTPTLCVNRVNVYLQCVCVCVCVLYSSIVALSFHPPPPCLISEAFIFNPQQQNDDISLSV